MNRQINRQRDRELNRQMDKQIKSRHKRTLITILQTLSKHERDRNYVMIKIIDNIPYIIIKLRSTDKPTNKQTNKQINKQINKHATNKLPTKRGLKEL